MVSNSTLLIILAIWFSGFVTFLYVSVNKWQKSWLDSLVIACASWMIIVLYAIHWVYNKFIVGKKD